MNRFHPALAAGLIALAATSARASDPSLVARWSFDEGAGAVAHDVSGNGHDGAIVRATWVDGLVGRALRFDGSTSLVRVPDDGALDLATALTIEAWVKLESAAGARVILSKWDDATQDRAYIFKKHNDQPGPRVELWREPPLGYADLPGQEPLALGRWLHVAATWDGAVLRLYVDGREDAAVPAPGLVRASAADLLIGAVGAAGPQEVFAGIIDEVSLYARALSPAEVAARFEALRPLLEVPFFEDGFDGAALDPARWGTALAEAGVRWCSTTTEAHHTNPGRWLDPSVEACNGLGWSPPSWGDVAIGGGVASFVGTFAPGFPYVFRGAPSPGRAFPAAGDFRLDARMRYDVITGYGTGLAAVRWPDVTPAGDNPPVPPGGGVFTVWADAATFAPRVALLDGLVYGGAPVGDPYGFHDYALEYRGGAYAARVDRAGWSEPVASAVRADALWLGNPVFTFWGPSSWTGFTVDRVAVTALPVLAGVDVKPGSWPNAINPGSNGVVPVAILGAAALDVRQVVVGSIRLDSAPVALRGKGVPMVSYADVNGDGWLDLVAHVSTRALSLSDEDEVAVLSATLSDGRPLRGADSVRIVP